VVSVSSAATREMSARFRSMLRAFWKDILILLYLVWLID
jgi:hypothetical protein